MTRDLTQGNPFSLVLGFSVPVLFGFLFQQFYNIVDTAIVGKFLGKEALAAVGATGSLNFLVIGFCMGVCNGFAIPIAQKFGAKDFSLMRKFVMASVYLSVVFSVALTVLTVVFCRPLLFLMRTPENIIDGAAGYIGVIFAGIPVIFLYNLTAGIIRSLGDSKTPLYFLIIASILNIVLDVVFITVFGWGVVGAAVATVISQGISGVMCLFYMSRKFEVLRMTKEDRKINSHLFPVLCGQGVPMGLQYSITAIGSVILQASVNTLGSDAVASVTAGSKLGMFFVSPYDALGTTMSTWGGQNAGARKYPRLKQGLFVSCVIGFVYSIIAFLIMVLFGNTLSRIFINADETLVLAQSHQFLILNSAFYFPLCLVNAVRFLIQGMGFSRFAILAGVFEMVARTLVGVVFVPVFGYSAACLASPAAWIFADCFLIPAFFWCYKKLERSEPDCLKK